MKNKLISFLIILTLFGLGVFISFLIFKTSQASPGPDCPSCLCNVCPAAAPCPAVCGNGVLEAGEACDGTDDAACPGQCQADCTCAVPPVCAPDGCNGICPANCTVAQDPDCGCQNGNGCCGIGCNHTNDNDCAAPPPTPPRVLTNPLQFGSLEELIEGLINFIFWVAIALAPLMIIIAAFYFLTSGGDPERVRTAKKIIFWTVIGVTIVFLAKGIIYVVRQVIGG